MLTFGKIKEDVDIRKNKNLDGHTLAKAIFKPFCKRVNPQNDFKIQATFKQVNLQKIVKMALKSMYGYIDTIKTDVFLSLNNFLVQNNA